MSVPLSSHWYCGAIPVSVAIARHTTVSSLYTDKSSLVAIVTTGVMAGVTAIVVCAVLARGLAQGILLVNVTATKSAFCGV